MNMQESVLYIVLALLCVVIYLLISQRKNKDDGKNNEELGRLKDSLTSSISTMSTSFNNLSKDVTRDMTQALTKVDEKVGVFNQQVEALNKGQQNFSRILAGVKQYGVLAEFSLASLLKDLLPASQYIANVKMKPDESGDNVEFAVKLQGAVVLQAGVDGGVTVADTVHVRGGPVPIGGVRAPCLTMRHRHRVRQKCQSSSAASIFAHAYFPIPLARLVRSSIVI